MNRVVAGLALLTLFACGGTEQAGRAPLGDFRLGHVVVVADHAEEGPFSRDLVETEIETSVRDALVDRLGRYDGDGLYHVGVYVGAAVLAQPGVPFVYVPGTNVVIDVSVFDNATRARVHGEPERMIVGEGLENWVPILGSGLTRDRREQIDNVAAALAKRIEDWLRDNPDWFAPEPGRARVPFTRGTPPPAGAAALVRPSDA